MEGKLLLYSALTIYFFRCSFGRVIESPQYKVIHLESDFEIRQYRQVSWMSALVQGTASFEKSTQQGFHRLYQYIHGANSNSSRLMMTSPVTTTITASTHGLDRLVRYYLPVMYAKNPPLPNSELPGSGAISKYTIAQYNSSHHPSGRLNEVWLDVSAFTAEGCQPL